MTDMTNKELVKAILDRKSDLARLHDADLRGAKLPEALLRGADLQRADLRGANLRKAILRKANLQKAILQRADLEGADLRTADLRAADLGGANLQGADLEGADLQSANLFAVDLRRANLRGANLREADLQDTDLADADLQDAEFRGAILISADLRSAKLKGASLNRALVGDAFRGTLPPEYKIETGLIQLKEDPSSEQLESIEPPAIPPEEETIERPPEQRPAAFQFRVDGGRIDVVPIFDSEVGNRDVAVDLHKEAVRKANALRDRLAQTNVDARARSTVDLVRDALGTSLSDVRPGILRSRTRSLEADARAYSGQDASELFPNAVAFLNDLVLSLIDLQGCYPELYAIEVEGVRLGIPPDRLDDVQDAIQKISEAASQVPEAVTKRTLAALKMNSTSLQEPRSVEVRAKLLADQALVQRNFLSGVARYWQDVWGKTSEKSKEEISSALAKAAGGAVVAGPAMLFTAVTSLALGLSAFVPGFAVVATYLVWLRRQTGNIENKDDEDRR